MKTIILLLKKIIIKILLCITKFLAYCLKKSGINIVPFHNIFSKKGFYIFRQDYFKTDDNGNEFQYNSEIIDIASKDKNIIPFLAISLGNLLKIINNDLNIFRSFFEKHGFYLLRKHYYLPIPDEEDISNSKITELCGINMNDAAQLEFTNNIILKYKKEFNSFPVERTDNKSQYHLINGSFMAGDGNAYYSLIRHLKPKTLIEIGSGISTLLACHAIEKNIHETNDYKCNFIAIEPYPAEYLSGLKYLTELKISKLQEVELSFFEQLESGDILFIDSSHVLKSGGDVWLEYCEIIPRLNSGVYVHIHDISLPKPYPKTYFENFLFWNEQYLLQALLTNNNKLEVIWAGTYLLHKEPEKINKLFSPELELMREVYPLAEPSSFWLRVK